MGGIIIGLLVMGTIVLLFFFYLVSLYNNLVTLKNRFANAFAQPGA